MLQYFESLGYKCPDNVDIADFLQELTSVEGRKYIVPTCFKPPTSPGGAESKRMDKFGDVPIGTAELADSWVHSHYYAEMMNEMNTVRDVVPFPAVFKAKYAGSLGFYYLHVLHRQVKLLIRDSGLIKARIMQSIVIGSIAGSLFSNIPLEDTQTMNGIIFFSLLNVALGAMALMPVIFAQRSVFYKHAKALLFPTSSFVFSQTVVFFPLQMLEAILFGTIVYWSAGLTSEHHGSRFVTFLFIIFAMGLCMGQYFRLLGSLLPSLQVAQPM